MALLIVFIFALRWMVADLIAVNVQRDLQSWLRQGSAPSLNEWESARARLLFAQRLNTNEPDLHSLDGDLFEQRIYIADEDLSFTEIQAFLELSAASYRRSINLRPAWPQAWLLLAKQKAVLAQFDGEFTRALEMATRMGTWSPETQLSAMEIAVNVWPFLPDDSRATMLTNLEKGLAFDYSDTTNSSRRVVARFADLLTEICPLLEETNLAPRVIQHCQTVSIGSG